MSIQFYSICVLLEDAVIYSFLWVVHNKFFIYWLIYLFKYVFNYYYAPGSTLDIGGRNGKYRDMVFVLTSLSSSRDN